MKKELFVVLAVFFVLFGGWIHFNASDANATETSKLMTAAEHGNANAQYDLAIMCTSSDKFGLFSV